MQDITVELVPPPPELRDWRKRTEGQEFFDRGERIIMVNGERWGRTHVSWHGCHGTSTSFSQEGGEQIGRTSSRGYRHEISVRSASERHSRRFIDGQYRLPDDFKNTEQLVLEKVRELIAAGQLRHPSIVEKERAEMSARMAERRAKAEAREQADFRAKALEAAGYTAEPNDPDTLVLVDRIVAAMRWAQTQ